MAYLLWIYIFTISLTLTGALVLWAFHGFDRRALKNIVRNNQNKILFLGLGSLITVYVILATIARLVV